MGPFTFNGPMQAALLTLALNEAAYMAEIFRAAISAIDKGQIDAARAIGMRPSVSDALDHPAASSANCHPASRQRVHAHAERYVAPGGDRHRELFGTIQSLNAATFRTFELFTIAAIWYLILTTLMGFAQRWIEARLVPARASRRKGIQSQL